MENLKHTVAEMIRNDNMAEYECCIGSNLIYNYIVENKKYTICIDASDRADVGDGVFHKKEKVITLMRWINKAIKNNNLRWEPVLDRGEGL